MREDVNRVFATFSSLRPAAKIGIVAAGYVVAFGIATLVLSIYVAATSGPDRVTSSGMYAFGDSLVFLAVLGVAAVPATGAGLFFLRSRRTFWLVLSAGAVVVACTALVALVLAVGPTSLRMQTWAMLAPLRVLVAPLLALFFLLSAIFAPIRSARVGLLIASAIEAVSFAIVAFTWLLSSR